MKIPAHRLCIEEFSSLSPLRNSRQTSGIAFSFPSRSPTKPPLLKAAYQIFSYSKQKDFIGKQVSFSGLLNFLMNSFKSVDQAENVISRVESVAAVSVEFSIIL